MSASTLELLASGTPSVELVLVADPGEGLSTVPLIFGFFLESCLVDRDCDHFRSGLVSRVFGLASLVLTSRGSDFTLTFLPTCFPYHEG